MGLRDDIFSGIKLKEAAEDQAEAESTIKVPTTQGAKKAAQVSQVLITGALAQAVATVDERKEQSLVERFDAELEAGLQKSAVQPKRLLISPEEKQALSDTVTMAQRFDIEFNPSARIEPEAFGIQSAGSEALEAIAPILSFEENAILAPINKWFGQEKADFQQNTYENLLKDMGVESESGAFWGGLAMSIGFVPSTYVTGGLSGFAKGAGALGKIGKTSVGLTKKGGVLVFKIAKEREKKEIAKLLASGKKLDPAIRSRVRREAIAGTKRDTLKFFTRLEEKAAGKGAPGLKVADDVTETFGDVNKVLDRGGLKWAGKRVLDGPRVLSIYNKVGATKSVKALSRYADILEKKTLPLIDSIPKRAKDSLIGLKLGTVDPFIELGKAGRDALKTGFGERFIPNFGVDKRLLDLYDDMQRSHQRLVRRSIKFGVNFTRGLDKKQAEEFAGIALKASQEGMELVEKFPTAGSDLITEEILSKLKSNDPRVQKLVDKWFGLGKFKGKGAGAKHTKRLLDAGLLTKEEAHIAWYPGITKWAQLTPFKVGPQPFSFRGFLRARVKRDKGDISAYTLNPARAFATRLIHVGTTELQEKFYKEIIHQELGDARLFRSASKAREQGFVPLRTPRELGVDMEGVSKIGSPDPAKRYYVKKEFADQYKKTFSRAPEGAFYRALNVPTQYFKGFVTTMFPSFHSRNHLTNIIFNSMSIGLHALDPRKFRVAIEIARSKPKLPMHKKVPLIDRIAGSVTDTLLRINPKRQFVNEVGETLTPRQLFLEAEEELLLNTDQFVNDLSGELITDPFESEAWMHTLQNYNPLSTQNMVMKSSRRMGGAIEENAKLINFVTNRMKGLPPDVAAKEAQEALFDYSAITNFERKAKLVIPFYTFQKKNLEKFIKLGAHRPGVAADMLKFWTATGPTQDDWEGMAPWAQSQYVANVRGMFLTGFGLPMEPIIEMARDTANFDFEGQFAQVNPILKYPFEKMVTGRDFFTGSRLEDLNQGNEFGPMLRFIENEKIPAALKAPAIAARNWLRLEEDEHGKITMDPKKRHFLRSLPTARFQSTLSQYESFNAQDKTTAEWVFRFITGIYTVEPNFDFQDALRGRKAREEMVRTFTQLNSGKAINFPVVVKIRGKRHERRLMNKFMEATKKGLSKQEKKDLLEDFHLEFEEFQKERVGIDDEVLP